MAAAGQSVALISDFADFLASSPAPHEILSWRPSKRVEDRFEELIAAQRDRSLSDREQAELERFRETEILLQLLKARLRDKSTAS